MIVVRILVGLSQLTWTCAIATVAERQREVADAGCGRRRSGRRPWPPRPTGSCPGGRTKSRIDRSCGREVPEHVDVGLDEAEVDADRVDVLEVAEVARRATSSRMLLDDRRVAVGVVAHEHEAALGRRRRPAARPSATVGGQRLLDQHVLAGLERGEAERGVRRGRRGDGDRLDRRVGQDLVEVVGDGDACCSGPTTLRARSRSRSQTQRSSVRSEARKLRMRFGPQ